MILYDLFAGAGGAGLGLRAVFPDATIVHVDSDLDACATLVAASAGDDVIHHGRVEDEPPPVGNITGVWASPPCQPYSRAGKRLGAADPRDGWPATLAFLAREHPAWFAIENVPGSPVERWANDVRDLGRDAYSGSRKETP